MHCALCTLSNVLAAFSSTTTAASTKISAKYSPAMMSPYLTVIGCYCATLRLALRNSWVRAFSWTFSGKPHPSVFITPNAHPMMRSDIWLNMVSSSCICSSQFPLHTDYHWFAALKSGGRELVTNRRNAMPKRSTGSDYRCRVATAGCASIPLRVPRGPPRFLRANQHCNGSHDRTACAGPAVSRAPCASHPRLVRYRLIPTRENTDVRPTRHAPSCHGRRRPATHDFPLLDTAKSWVAGLRRP